MVYLLVQVGVVVAWCFVVFVVLSWVIWVVVVWLALVRWGCCGCSSGGVPPAGVCSVVGGSCPGACPMGASGVGGGVAPGVAGPRSGEPCDVFGEGCC